MASGSTGVVIKALLANGGIAASKFVVALVSGSAAMLAEAMHSAADMGNQILLLVGLNRSHRAEDRRHEFGYGSERYFWAFIVGGSLFPIRPPFSFLGGAPKIPVPAPPPGGTPPGGPRAPRLPRRPGGVPAPPA